MKYKKSKTFRRTQILEFPVTFDAAKKGYDLGMTICMGAPNVVLGRSTSGNLSSCDEGNTGYYFGERIYRIIGILFILNRN